MNGFSDLKSEGKTPDLNSMAHELIALAQTYRGDSLALLELLRTIELVHRDIRDTLFLEALPNNRQALYGLLKDIEEKGCWPYIERMKLRSLLHNWSEYNPDVSPYHRPNSAEMDTLESQSEG